MAAVIGETRREFARVIRLCLANTIPLDAIKNSYALRLAQRTGGSCAQGAAAGLKSSEIAVEEAATALTSSKKAS
jgi:hypothetical protein